MTKFYGKEDYVSVWIGNCNSQEQFNEYIELKNIHGDLHFELGNDFGIYSYDEDFSLVYYSKNATRDLSILLDTGAPEYVAKHFIKKKGRFLKEDFNCCVMFYDMKYTGKMKEIVNEQYGKFVYLGSMASDKFDML